MSLFSTSDVLTMIFGVIGTFLTIITIAIMFIVRSASPDTAGDIEQGQPQRRFDLFEIIVRFIRFILDPENHPVIRRHFALITIAKNAYNSMVSKVIARFERGLRIRSRTFDLLFQRSQSNAGGEPVASEHEVESIT